MSTSTVTCSTPRTLRTQSVVIPAGSEGKLALTAENNTHSAVTRLLLAANGTGIAGLAGLSVTSIRLGNYYFTGGPLTPGLRGGATNAVSAEAFVALFSRLALRSGLPLTPGEDLVLTIRNDNTAARRVVATDNRHTPFQTFGGTFGGAAVGGAAVDPFAPAGTPADGYADARFASAPVVAGFAATPDTSLLTATATVPAGAVDHRIEVPRSQRAGWFDRFALHTPTPLDLRLGLAAGRATIIEPTYIDTLERAQDHTAEAGMFWHDALAVGLSEPLYILATNDAGAVRTVSFFAEMVHDGRMSAYETVK